VAVAARINNHAGLIWAIADLLRGDYKQSEYGRVILPLVVLRSPYRSVAGPLLDYLDHLQRQIPDQLITMILPEFVPARWWQHLLHNQTALMIKGALLFRKGIIVTSVPYHLER